MYSKKCPRCSTIIKYKRKNALTHSIKHNSTCKSCSKLKNIPYCKNKKYCPTCKILKLFKEFNKYKSSKDGLQSRCRNCGKQINKKYRETNRAKELIRGRNYRRDNPEKVKISLKKYRNNPENLQKLHEYDKKYREQNKEKIYQKQMEYRKNNPHKVREKSRRRRAKKAKVNENFTPRCEIIVYKTFHNKCFNCGSTENLCIDHHRPLNDGNPLTLHNAVILCFSCNSSKCDKSPEEFYGIKKCKILDEILHKQAKQ